ncbi:13131_t:CDS:1 [Acaulospora morrowiae]|uniref:13131_t:CDS:1 n=1 Tax=Acaulospora morrowiae TaxID=94023 RepID=A0A9N9CQK5_9GLOM|nr:13131_t:CDS:1 [Acaulospora morrowiae]
MTNLSDIPLVDVFKGVILDHLMRDGFLRRPPENFFIKHRAKILTCAAVTGGALLGPFAITGAVAALGFGQAGIVAGSTATWMMSLYRGYVTAGSLVSILQSVGAAGLGAGGVIAANLGGGVLGGAVASAISSILESNSDELRELETFLTIRCENDAHTTMVLDINFTGNEDEKLLSLLRGFDLARQVAGSRVGQFKFIIGEGSNILYNFLVDNYGGDRVTLTTPISFLNLND